MEENPNRIILDSMIEKFRYWLHIEDEGILYTLAAMKISHQLGGDPLWLMVIGPSSDGKTELMRAFTLEEELTIDNLTPTSFVSGFKGGQEDNGERKHLAQEIANRIWWIYDFSIILSKHYEERGSILSNLRLVYDGRITKSFGTKEIIAIDTPNNTLIVGSTPAIDGTILEDQILGTRFITYRTHTTDQQQVMNKIIDIEENNLMDTLRMELKTATDLFMREVSVHDIQLQDNEKQALMMLTKQTCILRTSIELERYTREVRNIATPESTGRLFKQLLKLYRAYRIIGLSDEEALSYTRKICIDSVLPLRLSIMEYLMRMEGEYVSISRVAKKLKIGKSTAKGHLFSLVALGLVEFEERYDDVRRTQVYEFGSTAPSEYALIVFGEQPAPSFSQEKIGPEGGRPTSTCGSYHGG